MLAPETRLLLTEALQPPAGYRVDVAVATTYSLNLTAMLLAPLTFALHDEDVRDLDKVDPLRLLDAVQRHAEHTTVFAQAGAIAVPSSYRRILTFTEECLVEVVASKTVALRGGKTRPALFHPKVWALRYVDDLGGTHHRFLCSSRNLTFDRSWDTLLILDEADRDGDVATVDPSPLARFLGELPNLATRPLSDQRQEQISGLCVSLGAARLAVPEGFSTADLLPLGFPWSESFPLPSATRSLLISPFLDATTARRFSRAAHKTRWLSRPETLDRIGADPLQGTETFVLQRAAEREVGEDQDDAPTVLGEASVPEGLHAKTFLFENGSDTTVITGSANATTAALTSNVEFDVVLSGPTKVVGISTSWEGTKEAPGFERLCQPYTAPKDPEDAAAAEETSWEIQAFHARLAQAPPVAYVESTLSDTFTLRLELPDEPSPGSTTVRPVTLPEAGWTRAVAGGELAWKGLGLGSVTPLFVVTTTAGSGPSRCTIACLLTAELHGDPAERRRDALTDFLKNQADVLRYLMLLLGDTTTEEGSGTGDGAGWLLNGPGGMRDDVIVFEPLVRALTLGGAALERVAKLHHDLQELERDTPLLPEGWEELWGAVWEAHQQKLQARR